MWRELSEALEISNENASDSSQKTHERARPRSTHTGSPQ
jgi:hypothetical protein